MTRRADDSRSGGRIVLFGDFAETGGIQRTLAAMVPVWAAEGHTVEIVTFRGGGIFFPDEIGAVAAHHDLQTRGRLPTLFALWRHLRRHPADAVLSCTHVANSVVCALGRLPGIEARRLVSVANPYGQSAKHRHAAQRLRKFREVRRLYPWAHTVITVSDGVRRDLIDKVGLRHPDIRVIHNAVINPGILERAQETPEHRWVDADHRPIIVSAGRLARQKDYPTLLKAFARLRERVDARLVIFGEGEERQPLETLVRELGLADHVALPGFVTNPYAWIARADVFALSSAWEGFGNVIAEALALGRPIVATNCPGGPREILQDGRFGTLVPVGDDLALAEALESTIRTGGPAYVPSEASRRFTADHTARAYLRAFGLNTGETRP
ncbi:glycosyltransferase [Thiococcus pfennigii]|uniref:glycosyltransferase n=2 Tax=Thiococcus pfennigii TaxID=1057 RepID=UPI0030B903F7